MESDGSDKSRKEKRKAKRINRLFDDVRAGAILQVDRRISKVPFFKMQSTSFSLTLFHSGQNLSMQRIIKVGEHSMSRLHQGAIKYVACF